MMAEKLAELFQASNGAPIEWHGKVVQIWHELSALRAGQVIEITFKAVSSARPQALRLKVQGGRLQVNGQLLDDLVIWSDTATFPVHLAAHPTTHTGPMSVRVWNAWCDTGGTMQAWMGNSGMVVKEMEDAVVLSCSDGFNDPQFDDLVAELRVDKRNEDLRQSK